PLDMPPPSAKDIAAPAPAAFPEKVEVPATTPEKADLPATQSPAAAPVTAQTPAVEPSAETVLVDKLRELVATKLARSIDRSRDRIGVDSFYAARQYAP